MTTKKKYVSSREERAQATREKLLEAAIELVNQYGMKYLPYVTSAMKQAYQPEVFTIFSIAKMI